MKLDKTILFILILSTLFVIAGNLNSDSDLFQNEYTNYMGYLNHTIRFDNNNLTILSYNYLLWYKEISSYCNINKTFASPMIYKGVYYFNCANETKVVALNSTTGQYLWNFTDNFSDYPKASNYPFDNNTYYNYRTMAIANDTLIYFAGNEHLYALNLLNNGSVKWYNQMNTPNRQYLYNGYSLPLYGGESPVIYNNYVYITSFANYVIPSISPQVIMRYPLNSIYSCTTLTSCSPFNCTSYIYCPNERDNNFDNSSIFSSDFNWWGLTNQPMIWNNSIYLTEYNGGLYVFNASNLSMEWNDTSATAYDFFNKASITIWNNTLYTNGKNRVHAYDINSRSHLWTYTKPISDNIIISTPIVYQNKLFVGGRYIYILNATTGTALKLWNDGDYFYSSPLIVSDDVYIGTNNRTYSVNATNVNQLWGMIGNVTKFYPSVAEESQRYFYSNPVISNNIIYFTGNKIYAYTRFIINNYTVYFNDTTIENKLESFGINVTYTSPNTYTINNIVYADLIYNNTLYSTTKNLQTNSIYFNVSLIMPNKNQDHFFWNLTIKSTPTNIASYKTNTSWYEQNITTIQNFTVNDTYCNYGFNPALCFDYAEEINLTVLTADKVYYNFKYGISNGSYKELYGELNNNNKFCLCMNFTVYNNYTLGYGEIQYKKADYSDRRFYTFSNNRVTSNTINTTLYLLNNNIIYGTSTSTMYSGNVTTYTTSGNITITVTAGNTTSTSYAGNITSYYNSTSNQTYTVYNPSSNSQTYDPSITNQIYDPSTSVTSYTPSTTITTQTSPIGSKSTPFTFTFKDTSLNAYIGNYSALLRWYPQLNSYRTISMGKTDDKGQTIMDVQVVDPDYRIGLYHVSGSLVKLLNPVRFSCLATPCSYSTNIEESTLDYSSIFKVENSLTYDTVTGIWTFIWNDPTQKTNSMLLKVFLKSPTAYSEICNSTGTGSTGVLTCDTHIYTGTLEGTVYRTASPLTPIANLIIETGTSPFRSRVGLFIGFLSSLTLGLVGIWSPIIAIVGLLVGLLIPLVLKSITIAIFMAMAVIVGVVIHFYKRTEG